MDMDNCTDINTGLSLRLLGPFQMYIDGQDRSGAFRTRKELALFVYLAAEAGHIHRRQTLAELFWPERPEGYARTNLRQALYGLRKAIGDNDLPYLRITDEQVEFKADYASCLDVEVFTIRYQSTLLHPHAKLTTCPECAAALQTAVSLYRGDFLVDVSIPSSQSFQEWVIFLREQYYRSLLNALHILSEYYQQNGDFDRAHNYAWRYVNEAPLEETAHCQLMNLLVLNGQRSAAIEQFHVCRKILQAELGIEPSTETVELYNRIRTGIVVDLAPTIADFKLTNLPAQMTSFIGRQDMLDRFESCLVDPACCLLTLVGMAGVGKTRLAKQVAGDHIDKFPDGIWFVPFEDVPSADQLPAAIAQALGLCLDPDRPARDQLITTLKSMHTLLVLDQFEGLLEGTVLLVDLLSIAPQVKMLVTSRQRLNYRAACLFELHGLPYSSPEGDDFGPDFPAAQLFLARAQHSRAEFTMTPDNRVHIQRICALADGLPLAVELAAYRLREYSVREIAESMESGLEILATTEVDIPERHRSLRTAFEPSWEVLTDAKRVVLAGLSMFDSGFTLADAQAQVIGIDGSVLLDLVGRYMLDSSRPGQFSFHPLQRRFVLDKVQEAFLPEPVSQQTKMTPTLSAPEQPLLHYDPLTRLPGQALLSDRLEHLLARAGRHQQMAGVLVLQVEGLDAIREALGEEQARRTLQSLAGYFRASLRDSDTIARVAENQFAFLLENIVSAEACQEVAERFAEFLPLIQIADQEFPLTIHLGSSIYPWHGDQAETLLQRASVALGQARQDDNICQLFTSRLEGEP